MDFLQEKEDFQIIYEITESFEDALLFLLTLKSIKHTSLIQDTEVSPDNINRLECIAAKYNKFLLYDDENDLLLSSDKLDSSVFSNHIRLGKLLGYPIQYNLRSLRNYRKRYRVSNYIFMIRRPPSYFTSFLYDYQLLNYMVKECDEYKVKDKTDEWIKEINEFLDKIYPGTYIELEIEEDIGYPDDLTEEENEYLEQFNNTCDECECMMS